jgi:hypothetical protein
MNELACRACRKALLSKEGCAVCNPIRRNLIVLGETDEERPSLATVSAEAVNSLRAQIREYREMLKDALDPDHRAKIHDKQRATAAALAKLLDAARKIQTDGVAAVERMSFSERGALFVEWFCSLPAAYREKMQKEIAALEAQYALPAESTVQ